MPLWHISIESRDRLPIFPHENKRRQALHALNRVAREVLLLFSIVDEHMHLVAAGDIDSIRRLRQALVQTLTPISDVALAPSWVGPVKGRKHLLRLIGYHVIQVVKHSVRGIHPALWSGSCFQDLIRARVLPGPELLTPKNLPREQMEVIACKEVGLPGFHASPIEVTALRELGVARIKAAAAAALAADEELTGNSRAEACARRVTVQLGMLAGISKQEIGWALEISRQALGRLARRPVPATLLDAARTRLALEEEVDRRMRRTIQIRRGA
jgi:hypothetical protein